jgi:hypothetical protein
MNAQQRTVINFLRSVGAENVTMGMGGKHPRALYTWNGKQRFYVLPGTPGDSIRGAKNSISDLRHALGLTKSEKTIGERRPRRARAHQPPAVLQVCDAVVLPSLGAQLQFINHVRRPNPMVPIPPCALPAPTIWQWLILVWRTVRARYDFAITERAQ